MSYQDKYGSFFGLRESCGNIRILHVADGELATRLDTSIYPVGSDVSARYEHASGIVLSQADARHLGIDVEDE